MSGTALLGWLLPVCVFVMMMCIGLELAPRQFLDLWRRPMPLLAGIGAQLLLVPAVGFALAWLFRGIPSIALAMIIVVSVPGGAIANAIVLLARARPDISVSLSVICGLACLATTPALISLGFWLLGADAGGLQLPLASTVERILTVTALPIVAGMMLRQLAGPQARRLQALGRLLALVMLLLILALVFSITASRLAAYWHQALLAAALLSTLMLLAVWYPATLSGLDRDVAFTLSIEASLHNVPLALLIAERILGRPDLGEFIVVYAPVIVILSLGWAISFKRRWHRDPGL